MHSYEVYVTRCIDGDTFIGQVETHIMDLQLVLNNIYFRMLGINAPEKRGASKEEGMLSWLYLKNTIEGKFVTVHADEADAFGRKLAVVFLDGININQLMVDEGMAIPDER